MFGLNRMSYFAYVVYIACCFIHSAGGECGGFVEVSDTDSGTIKSPNFPNEYNNNVNCIWLFKADAEYAVSMTTVTVDGEYLSGSCLDYLEIRNGSSEGDVLLHGCNSTAAGETVAAKFLWVRFVSNFENKNQGFKAEWEVVADEGTENDPYVECAMEIRCANKECVPWGYRCDNYNDCGCDVSGCDEVSCAGFGLSVKYRLAIGIGVGAGFFIIIFFFIGLIDIYLKKLSGRKYERHMERQKQLQRQKKVQAMAALFVGQPSVSVSEGSRTNSVSDAGARKASLAPGAARKQSSALSIFTYSSKA